jgi:large subunit ribosomal protein L10
MKTKLQKSKELEQGKQLLAESKNVVFADFSGVSIELLKRLKKELKKSDAAFRVIKKRLLRIAFKEKGIDFDPAAYEAQVGSMFIPKELSDGAAASIYKFSRELAKEKKDFKILGAYDLAAKKALTAEEFIMIAKLPSREVLLGQLLGMLTVPLRQFMFVVDQLSKKTPAAGGAGAEQVVEKTN